MVTEARTNKLRALASVPNRYQIGPASSAEGWGWLPALSLVGAVGLLLLAIADTGARNQVSWAMPLFWLGVLMLFVPIAARMVLPSVPRRERIGLVVVLGLGLYIAKVLHSPVHFTFVDEFQHWRTADDIVQTSRLFGPNPILPASSFFPALEIVTTALTSLTGLTYFSAGIIVLGAARLVFVLALYLFYEEVGRSAWLAGIASLLYMCNPSFVFFDAVFAYESLALPFAAIALLAVVRRDRRRVGEYVALTWVALLGIGAVTITHHLTSYALVAFLILWALVSVLPPARNTIVSRSAGEATPKPVASGLAGRLGSLWAEPTHQTGSRAHQSGPGGVALWALVAGLAWHVYVASMTVGYLLPQVRLAISSLAQLIVGEAISRQLFLSAGKEAPLWEQLITYASVGLTLLGLLFGLLQVWQRRRRKAVALVLAAGALVYPLSLACRFTDLGMVLSVRAFPYLFASVAFVLAMAVVRPWSCRLPVWARAAAVTVSMAVIFVGGIVLGWPQSWRLPGPYLVASQTRSVDAQSMGAVQWARAYLGPHNRVVTDWANSFLMGSFGYQEVVTGVNDKMSVAPVFFSAAVGPAEQAILQRAQVRYIVVDRRLNKGLPVAGWYIEYGEPGTYHHDKPMDLAVLEKFDHMDRVSRSFDSGDIVIYDVGELTGAP